MSPSRRPTMALAALMMLATVASAERWSRQLTDETSFGEWIPLDNQQTPIATKRQASARVLNQQPAPFQSSFFPGDPGNNYVRPEAPRLLLQSAGQSFVNQQNQPLVQLTLTDPQYNPLAQGFVQHSPMQYSNVQYPQYEQQQQSLAAHVIQHPVQINNQFYNGQVKKQQKQEESLRFVDGYKAENMSVDFFDALRKKPQTPVLKAKVQQQNPKMTERSSNAIVSNPTTAPVTTVEKEEVQLLYVPLESLQNEKPFFKSLPRQEALRDSVGSPGQINNQLYTPTTPNYSQRQHSQLHNIQQDLIQQALNAQALQGKFKHQQFDYRPSSTVTFPFTQSLYPTPVITTPRSKKLKAHQPPLAIYMVHTSQNKAKLSDVLGVLKEAKGISVLDSVGPNSPKVFVGPSNLRTPEHYAKFELPYLSSVDGNRIQRNIDRLPFFVAPLSYNAPNGFARIPFPAPHVGSVIVNPFMDEGQDVRPTNEPDPGSFSFSTYQQNPSTESFRSTVGVSSPPIRQTTFNFFPSATPNPTQHQSTIPNYQSTFLSYDQQQNNNAYRPLSPSRKPESPSSSRQPLSSYFSTTPSKPTTVSFFSFGGPEYSTIPTIGKPKTTSNYQYKGHYITNPANEDEQPGPIQLVSSPKDIVTSDRPKTTSRPSPPPPTFPAQNPYSINHAFQPTTVKEPEIKNVKVNEINEYSAGKTGENSVFRTQYTNEPKPTTVDVNQFSSVDDIASFFGHTSSSRPNEVESSSVKSEQDTGFRYSEENNTAKIPYSLVSEYNEITTPSTTTTTTTTTVAPSTRPTRRPIHLRGRPRSTTPKPDSSEQLPRTTTTRRTPVRERKPTTYRSRYETTKASNTEAEATEAPSSSFEPSKKRKIVESESYKPNRYSTQRSKLPEDEASPTTESALPKTSAAARNQRLRSRGKTQFKTSDEGSEYVPKKSKKTEGGDSSLAYQRDVLHQNYPVTLTERGGPDDVQSSTSAPVSQSIDLTNGKIRIYETTGSTQRPYSVQEELESTSQYYDNQPVFQGESQKFLTQSDRFVDANSERTGSTLSPELYFVSRDSSTERYYPSSTLISVSPSKSTVEEYDIVTEITKDVVTTKKAEVPRVEDVTEKVVEPTTLDTPVARFRSKLRSRPKFLLSSSVKDAEDNSLVSNKKTSDDVVQSTRRSSVQPVTYRPAFDRLRTTMKIEDIEAELKSSRQQVRTDSQSTTYRYPVYIPESTTTEASTVDLSTTKRNHFTRRRPVRPAGAATNIRSRTTTTTTSEAPETVTKKVIKPRGRLRTRPTTTEKIDDKAEEIKSTTEKSAQKYTTRGRLATQKYFRRPSPVTEKNSQTSQEADDQAFYDSINRPEYVEYKVNNEKGEFGDYNPENGKAESHWSPKVSFSSFKPIFNPNLIAEEVKIEGAEYGTKLPTGEGESEIITAKSTYEDMLITVTPPNYTDQKVSSSFYDDFFPSSTYKSEKEDDEKGTDAMSTFESMLEEVMKNLERQDEDEYDQDGRLKTPVIKKEIGEIGEIPPETTVSNQIAEQEVINDPFEDIRKVETLMEAQEEFNDRPTSTTAEIKYTTSTERQPRRKGVWRRVKVRPVRKNALQTSESQYYGKTVNEFANQEEVKKAVTKKEEIKEVKVVTTSEKPETTTAAVEINTTIMSTDLPEQEMETETIKSPGDMDLGTGSPEVLMMNVLEEIANTEETPVIEDESSKDDTEFTTEISTTEVVNESITNKPEVHHVIGNVVEVKSNVTEEIDDSKRVKPLQTYIDSLSEKKTIGVKQSEVKMETVESTTSVSNVFDPNNVISTSMSTEVSHETEICYRGRCIKTKKDDRKKVISNA